MERFITEITYQPVVHDPFAGPSIVLTSPTTEPQREVWAASQMSAEASCAYNESVSLELEGVVDIPVIANTIDRLVQRHEGLRTVFDSTGMRVLVLERVDIHLEVHDLSGRSNTDQEEERKRIGRTLMTTPFDLMNGPLFRAVLFKLANDRYVLRLVGHHAVCDGWSLGILMADISRIYSALLEEKEPELPEAIPHSRYAEAINTFYRSGENEQVKRYWKELFAEPIPRVDLPTDRPRPAEKTWTATRLDIPMDPALITGLKQVATRYGSSFVTTLLSVYEVLIARITGQRDLVIGLPAAGQSDMGMKDLVGHCVSLLPLRTVLDEEIPFHEYLKERRKAVLDAFDHQRFTFSTLLQELNVPREPGRVPLVPVIFNIDMNMDDGVAFKGIRHRFVSDPRAYEQFELTMNASGSGDRMVMEWSYNADLFDERTVRGWMNDLTALVERVSKAPETRLIDLIEEDAERAPIAPIEWSGTTRPLDPALNVATLFDQAARTHADSNALVQGNASMTYTRLRDRVDTLAAHLITLGVAPGVFVGLCATPGFDLLTGLLAIVRAGGAFVPIDPTYPAERLSYLLEDSRVPILLTDRRSQRQLTAFQGRTVWLDDLGKLPVPTRRPAFSANADDPLYMIYTSGSTGQPKGVVVPHRGIVRLMREQNYFDFGPELVFHHHLSISFDASQLSIMCALLHGGTLVLSTEEKPSLPEIAGSVKKHGVNALITSTGLFKLLVDEHLHELKGLRHLLVGGDVFPLAHARKAFDVLGPGVLMNGYGPTEDSVMCTVFTVKQRTELDHALPIGKPLPNAPAYVLDVKQRPVRIGQKGELYLGGPGVALGYWQREELTAQRFLRDPFAQDPTARMYRTGDQVRWRADGNLEFIGRVDDQIKIRGFRVELGELEAALNDLPSVKDKVAIALAENGGEKQIFLYIVPTDDSLPEDPRTLALLEKVKTHLAARVPEHMLPAAVIALRAMPITSGGKPDKKKLPAPPKSATRMRMEYAAPRDTLEALLAGIWAKLLKVDRVGVSDNFFEIGGHSLLGIQMFAQVEKQTGKRLPIKTLFQAPTIAQLALVVGGEKQPVQAWKNLSAIQPNGTRVPFFCVHGDEANIFVPRYLGEDQPFYGYFHQGEDGHPIAYTSVERIAQHFIQELRSARPHGPYLLGGYSFGGIVAYEMACQLVAAGEQVPLLALFDTYAPEDGLRSATEEEKTYMPIKRWVMRKLVKRYLNRGELLPAKVRHFHIIDTYGKATRAYRAPMYPGRITLIRANGSPGAKDMGWGRLAQGGVEVRPVQGDHYSVIKEPHVRALANELRASIDRAMGSSSAAAL
ncbi:MAG: amino acid adenylation domain-containing protein [Flavobacteriales bacterium]|nr:amino acid adenylation domain-containing protein [Flavobacteriales bacterium]MBP6697937.1 amino acid adenylation domain-containing protein [Flavobacteriales bacterium]